MALSHGRLINTAIWRDDWFLSLRESEQHLFLYLLTAPASSISGVYQLGLAEAAFHTKIDQQEIKRIFLERFEPDGKVFFEVGYVILRNHLKHQRFNPNQWKAVANDINHLPRWLCQPLFDPKNPHYIPFEDHSEGFLTVGERSPKLPEPSSNGSLQDKIRKDKYLFLSEKIYKSERSNAPDGGLSPDKERGKGSARKRGAEYWEGRE